jgi:uncharacterized protein (TIGR03083 family)
VKPTKPIATVHLFPGLHKNLIALLRSLTAEDWLRPTVAGSWLVRDVVAHILDVQIRRISIQRDGCFPPTRGRNVAEYTELVDFLNELNMSWVAVMQRASPRALMDMLQVLGPQLAEVVAALDPEAPAIFPVAWAGEDESKNWFDIGREYTELWHHQAQVRLAVDADPLVDRKWLHPVLALGALGLSRALRNVARPDGTAVVLRCDGDAGGTWSAVASSGAWWVHDGAPRNPVAEVEIPSDVAWQVFFNALTTEEAREHACVEGDEALAAAVLSLRSVMV